MFNPKYSITPKLLENIKKITALSTELNLRHFPKLILLELEKSALSLSSHTSTSIEGNPLPLTEVKKIIKNMPKNVRDSEKEVLNYNKALQDLNDLITKSSKSSKDVSVNLDLILDVHKKVMKGLLPQFSLGKIRKVSVVVKNPRTSKTTYFSPDYKDVGNLISDLIFFINENEKTLDLLILAGLFHKQFVLIHPFVDGNGRTVRLLTKVLLAKMGLNTFNLFSFENYYSKNVTKYFEKVGAVGDYYDIKDNVDFTEWLEYFTDGIIDELLRVKSELESFYEDLGTGAPMTLHDSNVFKYILGHGFINEAEYSKISNRAKSTRALDLKRLSEKGFIKRVGSGKSTYYTF